MSSLPTPSSSHSHIPSPLPSIPPPSPVPSPTPSPLPIPPHLAKPVRKLSNAASLAISAGEAAFHTLTSQVGGHPGVMASADNTLIVKTCLPCERAFYELLARGSGDCTDHSDNNKEGEQQGQGQGQEGGLDRLVKWTPRFYGTLRLEGRVKTQEVVQGAESAAGVPGVPPEVALEQGFGSIEPIPEVGERDKYLFFSLYAFRALFTTSDLTYLLLLNAQSIVMENVSSLFSKPNIIDIKLGTVLYEEGVATPEKKERMLETARSTTSLETGVRLTGFQVYDYTTNESIITPQTYGKTIKASELPDGIRRFLPLASSSTPTGKGLPRDLLVPITRGILDDIKELRDVLAKTELRIVGSSLLIVYEADWEAARAALEAQAATAAAVTLGVADAALTNSAGVEVGDEDEDELGYDSDAESEEEVVPAYVVKLIDFAHTRPAPGEGPDMGVLKGLDTAIALFEGRIRELGVD